MGKRGEKRKVDEVSVEGDSSEAREPNHKKYMLRSRSENVEYKDTFDESDNESVACSEENEYVPSGEDEEEEDDEDVDDEEPTSEEEIRSNLSSPKEDVEELYDGSSTGEEAGALFRLNLAFAKGCCLLEELAQMSSSGQH